MLLLFIADWDNEEVSDTLQEVEVAPLTTEECREQMPGPEATIVKDAQLCVNDKDGAGEVGACSV